MNDTNVFHIIAIQSIIYEYTSSNTAMSNYFKYTSDSKQHKLNSQNLYY